VVDRGATRGAGFSSRLTASMATLWSLAAWLTVPRQRAPGCALYRAGRV